MKKGLKIAAITVGVIIIQYINGLVAEAETLKEMLSLCRKGTTSEDIEEVLEELL